MSIKNTDISPLLSEGNNITLSQSGNVITVNSAPSGLDTQVQFNDGGVLAGDSGLTFNKTTDLLTTGAVDLTLGQIKFPSGQNASADINTLDDYQENTWTPTLSATGCTFNYAANGRIGHYTKIGRMVSLSFRIQLATTGNTLVANTMTITGLPYASGSGTNRAFYSSIYWANLATSVINVLIEIPAASSTINVFRLTAAATSPGAFVGNNLSTTAGSVLGGHITYFV